MDIWTEIKSNNEEIYFKMIGFKKLSNQKIICVSDF